MAWSFATSANAIPAASRLPSCHRPGMHAKPCRLSTPKLTRWAGSSGVAWPRASSANAMPPRLIVMPFARLACETWPLLDAEAHALGRFLGRGLEFRDISYCDAAAPRLPPGRTPGSHAKPCRLSTQKLNRLADSSAVAWSFASSATAMPAASRLPSCHRPGLQAKPSRLSTPKLIRWADSWGVAWSCASSANPIPARRQAIGRACMRNLAACRRRSLIARQVPGQRPGVSRHQLVRYRLAVMPFARLACETWPLVDAEA